MTFGSLFSGIGGMDLGFERAGMRCVWQVEIDEYCRKVLAKHWPDVPRWDDVRTFTGDGFERPDVICGGFPCQDISLAGSRAGLAGERSGLWWEFARIIRLLRPRYAVVENVLGILAPTESGRPAPIGCVLGELARLGYDAEWQSISASAFGSTQLRYRVFIIAHHANHDRPRLEVRVGVRGNAREELAATQRVCATHAGHANAHRIGRGQRATKDGDESGERRPSSESGRCDSPFVGSGWWSVEPPVVRMVYGLPRGVVRPAIRGLGNCVIPQVAEWVGRRLIAAAREGCE